MFTDWLLRIQLNKKIIERQTIKLKWDSLVIQQSTAAQKGNKNLSKGWNEGYASIWSQYNYQSNKGTISDEGNWSAFTSFGEQKQMN